MWNFIKRMFGFGKKDESYMDADFYKPLTEGNTRHTAKPNSTANVRPKAPPLTPTNASKAVYKATYYRRNGNYYLYEDDSLLEDLFIIEMLMSMFDEAELEYDEGGPEPQFIVDDEVETTIETIDAAVEEVRQETPRYSFVASTSEPESEPEKSTSSYGSGSSSYDSSDSGSSDSGGGGSDD